MEGGGGEGRELDRGAVSRRRGPADLPVPGKRPSLLQRPLADPASFGVMRRGSRLAALAAVCTLAVAAACGPISKGSKEQAGQADGGALVDAATRSDGAAQSDASGITAGPKAGALLTDPTATLADQAAAEHTPTAQESALIGVYWAFLVSSSQSGGLDPTVLQSGLQDQILAIAGEYPTFFATTAQPGEEAGPGGYYPLFVNSPNDFSCTSGCTPGFKSFFSAGAGVLGAITSLSTSPSQLAQLLDVEDAFLNALKAGNSLSNAALSALGGNAAQTLINIGNTIAQGAGLLASTAAEGTAIATVGSVWAAFTAGYGIGSAISLVIECKQWQGAHACGTTCCQPPFVCADHSNGVCCPQGQGIACGTACCATPCADPSTGQCCTTEQTCGSTCCASGATCLDPATSTCCPPGEVACGSVCCPPDAGLDAGMDAGMDAGVDAGSHCAPSTTACGTSGACCGVDTECSLTTNLCWWCATYDTGLCACEEGVYNPYLGSSGIAGGCSTTTYSCCGYDAKAYLCDCYTGAYVQAHSDGGVCSPSLFSYPAVIVPACPLP